MNEAQQIYKDIKSKGDKPKDAKYYKPGEKVGVNVDGEIKQVVMPDFGPDHKQPEQEPVQQYDSYLDYLNKNLDKVYLTSNETAKDNFSYIHVLNIQGKYNADVDARLLDISEHSKYFIKLADRVKELAINLKPNVDALPTFTNTVNHFATKIYTDIVTGSKLYSKYNKYNTSLESDDVAIESEEIILTVKLAITKGDKPLLVWIISSHEFKTNEKDKTKIDLINTIELFSE